VRISYLVVITLVDEGAATMDPTRPRSHTVNELRDVIESMETPKGVKVEQYSITPVMYAGGVRT
jgi:hypothetical protein